MRSEKGLVSAVSETEERENVTVTSIRTGQVWLPDRTIRVA